MTEETREQLEAEERARRALAGQQQAESGGFLTIMMKFFADLLKAIFGAFNDTTSEYSEIDQSRAKHSNRAVGAQAAEQFLATIGNGKLRDLAAKYEGKKLTNISPFDVEATITSGIGHRDVPIAGASSEHKGLDSVPTVSSGAPVRISNTMPGVVVRAETQYNKDGKVAGFGNWVEVACIDGTRRRYAHLASMNVKVGDVLDQGQKIGIMGNTGTGTGAHLHYEWRKPNGELLAVEMNGKAYHDNDPSYVRSKVSPGTPLAGGDIPNLGYVGVGNGEQPASARFASVRSARIGVGA